MSVTVGICPQQAHLFGSPQNQSNRSPGCQARIFYQLQRGHGDTHTGTVINGPRAKVPAVQMRANDHDLVGRLPAHDFGNHVPGPRSEHLGAVHFDANRERFTFRRNALQLISIRIRQRQCRNAWHLLSITKRSRVRETMAIGAYRTNEISDRALASCNTRTAGAGLIEVAIGRAILRALHRMPYIGNATREATLWYSL